MNERIDILLSRYFAGEASDAELRQLDNWLAESKENETYFDELTTLYEQSAMVSDAPVFDTQSALSDFKAYMQQSEEPTIKRRFKFSSKYRAIAASIILVVGLFSFFMLRNDNVNDSVKLVADNTSATYTLYDDTDIVLDVNSNIEYIDGKEHEVTLRGKATFNVKSEQEKQLLVHAGETFIKDIGTVFTVTAYDSTNLIMVEVQEGEVLFYTKENEGIYIRPQEVGLYNTTTKEFSYMDTMTETADEIIFDATPLSEVVNMLKSRYDTQIVIGSKSLENTEISVTFDKHESIDNIIHIIAETLSINVSKNENSFVISQ